MPAKIYYDKDADLSLLKNKTIAILGYGSQGHAHAQNLRDSGCNVIVGRAARHGQLRAGRQGRLPAHLGRRGHQAGRHHHHPAARRNPGRHLPHPDPRQPVAGQRAGLLARVQRPLRPVRRAQGRVDDPGGAQGARATWCAAEFVRGAGVPCLIALGEGAGDDALKIGLAYAKGIGGTRAGVIETTFAEETETDLFGEQVVLCGGVSALIKAGFETLVEAGYQPEMAYFECVHELKLIVDLIYQGGLNYMRYSISNTAEYGDYTRGPRIVTDETKAEMKKILDEIQNGPVRPRVDPGEQGQRPGLQGHAPPRAEPPGRGGRPRPAAS